MRISEEQFKELGGSTSPGDARKELVQACRPVRLVYLLFYVTKNHHGDSFFAEAAQTRLQNIQASIGYDPQIHKVHCPPIQDLGEIVTIVSRYIATYGGEEIAFCKEVGVFSHSGWDGPIGSQASTVDPVIPYMTQMGVNGWGTIKFNWWNEQPLFAAYGCNSANEDSGASKSFAKNLSSLPNFSNVETWGQSTSSFPSFFPDYRTTTWARNANTGWNVGKTYQVGGNNGEGWKATSPSLDYPPANPLNCYKNGSKIRSVHQGYYNDHRKAFALVTV